MNCCYCQKSEQRISSEGEIDKVKGKLQCNKYKKVSLHERLTYSLYHKYAESQNYYYSKDINDIIMGATSKANVTFKDYQMLDEETEYFKKVYPLSSPKQKVLIEFYKVCIDSNQFHKDLPRWTVSQSIINILNKYYNHSRKIEYFRIQKLIEQENQRNPNQPQKGIVGDRPMDSVSDSMPYSIDPDADLNNVLADLQFTEPKQSYHSPMKLKTERQQDQPCLKKEIENNFQRLLRQAMDQQEERTTQLQNAQKEEQKLNLSKNSMIQKIVLKQKRQLSIKHPDNCEQLDQKLAITKHAEILQQLHKRVQQKLKIRNASKTGKREIKSVHFDQSLKKENFFKSPRENNKTPKSTTKPFKISITDSAQKKFSTGFHSSRPMTTLAGAQKIVFRTNSHAKQQCKTLTTPRNAVLLK